MVKKLVLIGQLHPAEQKQVDVKETYVAELNLFAILNATSRRACIYSSSTLPSITRDIALELDRTTAAGEIVSIIKGAGTKLSKRRESIRRL